MSATAIKGSDWGRQSQNVQKFINQRYSRERKTSFNKSSFGYSTNTSDGVTQVSDLLSQGVEIFHIDVNLWWTNPLQLDDIFPKSVPSKEKSSIADWINSLRNDMPYLEGYCDLADRITSLRNEETVINDKSLSTFIMFLKSNHINNRPFVGLKDNGYIDALWKHSSSKLIEIIFHPGEESQIVTFSPDLVEKTKIIRRVATLPINNMLGIIHSRKLDSLLFN